MNRFPLLALSLACVAVTLAAEPALPESLQVEIMIYSGRPNPVFTLTDPTEIRELLGTARTLPQAVSPSATAVEARPVLGYRGIAVMNRSKVDPELQSFVVHRSGVQLKQAASAPGAATAKTGSVPDGARIDASGALEQRLLALAQAQACWSPPPSPTFRAGNNREPVICRVRGRFESLRRSESGSRRGRNPETDELV